MAEPSARAARRRLAVHVTVLSVTVGAVVGALSAVAGAGACSAAGGGGAGDAGCYQLVRTLAQREGIVAAAITAIVVLMMVGLSRTATRPERGVEER